MNPRPKKYPQKAATSVVCGQDSPPVESADNLCRWVASSIVAGSKLSRLMFTAFVDALILNRGTSERTAAQVRQRKLNSY